MWHELFQLNSLSPQEPYSCSSVLRRHRRDGIAHACGQSKSVCGQIC
jgi:hypothetical protein